MITLQNISNSSREIIITRGSKFDIKQVATLRFIHLSDTEYNLVTKNGANPLTGHDGEDNTSKVWKWISPLDECDNPVVPAPTEETTTPPTQPIQPVPSKVTCVEDRIIDGGAKAPSQNAVYDALVEKAEWGSGSVRPVSPKVGQMWYDQNIKRPIWWDGDSWVDFLGGDSISGSMTVSGQGQLTIPCQGQPLDYEVHFNDDPVWVGCGSQATDSVDIEVISTPTVSLNISWNIATNSRAIEWSAHIAMDV